MFNLEFKRENISNIIKAVQDQKFIKSWHGVHTINNFNLLQRSAKVCVIIDSLINYINHNNENMISQHIQLESMRNGLYEDLGKTVLNDLSKQTKLDYPDYAKSYEKHLKEINSDLNLSKNPSVILFAQIGDILNSHFESKLEFSLGNKTPEIINSMKNLDSRLELALSKFPENNTAFNNKVMDSIKEIISGENNLSKQYLKIIENTQKQTTVERWAKRLTLNNFNLLEHTARVTVLSDLYLQLYKNDLNIDKSQELNVFRYSLYHDAPEVVLNDMPSPVKRIYPNLDKIQKQTEKTIMEDLNLVNSKIAKFICKISDIYDCRYESAAEIKAGNQDQEFKENFNNYLEIYRVQENKYKDYIPEIISEKIKEIYLDPVLNEINVSNNFSEIKQFEKQYIDSIVNNIVGDKLLENELDEIMENLNEKQVKMIELRLEIEELNNPNFVNPLNKIPVCYDVDLDMEM